MNIGTDRTSTSSGGFSRREFLAAGTAFASGLIVPKVSFAIGEERKRVLRVAHLTDVHVQPELRADGGMAACLRHVQDQKDQPGLILFGGDHVMDSFEQTRDRTKLQWDLWSRVLKTENSIPTMACIGNHDIWGWNKAKSQATGSEVNFGKRWAVETLGLPNRFYSFAKAGWHFIALDGVQPGAKPETYAAHLDEEQFDWLGKELSAVPIQTPILIWSHVPIVSAMPMLKKRSGPTAEMNISPGTCHTDAGAITNLLAKHPNVKVCLSGHLHQVDHVQVKGVNFHCNGAVSGNWWRGTHEGFGEGYAVVDLFNDGSYTCEYVTYGWQADDIGNSKQ